MTKTNAFKIILILLFVAASFAAKETSEISKSKSKTSVSKNKYKFDLKKMKEEFNNTSAVKKGDTSKKVRKPTSTSKALILYSVRMIIYLTIITFIIVMVLKYLKKKKFTSGKGGLSNKFVEILETSYIGPKQSIGLVKIMDRVVMVGITENNITLLNELDKATEAAIVIKNKSESADMVSNQFSSTINGFLEKFKKSDINRVSDYEK